jgi:hypothetical protein
MNHTYATSNIHRNGQGATTEKKRAGRAAQKYIPIVNILLLTSIAYARNIHSGRNAHTSAKRRSK